MQVQSHAPAALLDSPALCPIHPTNLVLNFTSLLPHCLHFSQNLEHYKLFLTTCQWRAKQAHDSGWDPKKPKWLLSITPLWLHLQHLWGAALNKRHLPPGRDPRILSSAEQGTYYPAHKRTRICLLTSFFFLWAYWGKVLFYLNAALFIYNFVLVVWQIQHVSPSRGTVVGWRVNKCTAVKPDGLFS